MSSSLGNRLQMDIRKLMMAYKVELNDDDDDMDELTELTVDFHGPKDSFYEGGLWKVKLFIPDDYPHDHPNVLFDNKIYHPNIDEETGFVCLDVLSRVWRPTFDLLKVFQTFLPTLLFDPNPEDPLNLDAAALMMSDLSGYERRVKEYCEKYAKPKDEAVSSDEKSTDKEPSEAEPHSSDETVVAEPDH